MNILEITQDYNFDDLDLESPSSLTGGSYFTKIINKKNYKGIYLQLPKCSTKQGIVKNNTKSYTDLMFNSTEILLLKWLEEFENFCQKKIYDKKELWFHTDFTLSDVQEMMNPLTRLYKSGKYTLLRCQVKNNKIKIYDENENNLEINSLKNEDNIIPLINLNGIKFTSNNFTIDINLTQLMIVNNDDEIDNCIINIKSKKNNIKNNNNLSNNNLNNNNLSNNNLNNNDLSNYDLSNDDLSNDDLSNDDLSNDDLTNNKSKKNNIKNNNLSNDNLSNDNLSNDDLSNDDLSNDDLSNDDLSNNKSKKNNIKNNNLSNDNLSNDNLSSDNLSSDNLSKYDLSNNKLTNDDLSNHDLSNYDLTNNKLTNNKLNSDKISNDKISNDNKLYNLEDNLLHELNLDDLNEDNEKINIKDAELVHYEIYKAARKKAKQIKQNAIEAYLEAKKIKNQYMLYDIDNSSDSDIDNLEL